MKYTTLPRMNKTIAVLAAGLASTSLLFAVDTDGDGLDDAVETDTGTFVDASNTGTDPNSVDSDGDGFIDGFEVASGTDPNVADASVGGLSFDFGNINAAESSVVADSHTDTPLAHSVIKTESGTLHVSYSNGSLSAILLNYKANDGSTWTFPNSPRTLIRIFDAAPTPDGDFVVCGYIMGSHPFGNQTYTSQHETDPWVGVIDTSGNWKWVRQIRTSAWSFAEGLTVSEDGSIFITGHVYGSVTVGTDSIGGRGWYDAFLAKLDSQGNWQWATSLGSSTGDMGRSVRFDSEGMLIWIGEFTGTATCQGQYVVSNGGGLVSGLNAGGDIFSAKVNPDSGLLLDLVSTGSQSTEGFPLPLHINTNGKSRGDIYLTWHEQSSNLGQYSFTGSDIHVVSLFDSASMEWKTVLPLVELSVAPRSTTEKNAVEVFTDCENELYFILGTAADNLHQVWVTDFDLNLVYTAPLDSLAGLPVLGGRVRDGGGVFIYTQTGSAIAGLTPQPYEIVELAFGYTATNDRDGDGVPDDEDLFPDDPKRADIIDHINCIIGYVSDDTIILDSDWKKKRDRAAYINKLEAVLELVTAAETTEDPEEAAALYAIAASKVQKDLLKKANRWLVTQEAKDIIIPDLEFLLDYLLAQLP